MKNTKAKDIIKSIEEETKELREVVTLDRDVAYSGTITAIRHGSNDNGDYAILEWNDGTISFTSGAFETRDAIRFLTDHVSQLPIEVVVVRTQKISEKSGNPYNKMYIRVIE
jgi:hypothetical protein